MRLMQNMFLMAAVLLLSLPAAAAGAADNPAEKPVVAILPLAVHADQDLAYLADGAADMLASRLAAEAGVQVMDPATIKSAAAGQKPPATPPTARAAGQAAGADVVLFGSITRLGQSFSLDIKALQTAGDQDPASFYRQTGSLDGVIPAVNAIARDISRSVFQADLPAAEKSAAEPPQPADSAKQSSPYAHPESLLTESGSTAAAGTAAAPPPGSSDAGPAGSSAFVMAREDDAAADFWKSRDFEQELCGLAVADVDGDGKQETVLLAEDHLSVRRLEQGRFYQLAERPATAGERFLAVDAVDTDGNGKAEIFVSAVNQNADRTASFVLELADRTLVPVADKQPWLFKSLEDGRIYGQRKGRADAFSEGLAGLLSAGIWRLEKQGDDYVRQEKLAVPDRFSLFAVNPGVVRPEGTTDVIVADDDDRLRLYAEDDRLLWTSTDHYGGSETYLTGQEDSDNQIGDRVYLPRRVLVTDINADGRNEVLTLANTAPSGRLFSRFRHYTRASFVCLAWDGLGLAERWHTRPVSGYAADLALADMNNDGVPELAGIIVSSRQAAFSKPRSAVISYDLKKIR
ncbi:MAG: FG-GAP-like repeat-containing protein [Desulfosudaceae bacterium]